jgi:hypothetical protein
MSHLSKDETVRVLINLDTLAASGAPDRRRAWAHLFIAVHLIQKEIPSPEKLTRERFLYLAGKVYDSVYDALERGSGIEA